jgi:hypothetical protein
LLKNLAFGSSSRFFNKSIEEFELYLSYPLSLADLDVLREEVQLTKINEQASQKKVGDGGSSTTA